LCCRDSGWRIPEQTAIVSCSDDYVMPSVILPKLSGFPLAAAEIGRTAVQWCLDPASRSETAPIRQFYQEEESFLSIKHNKKTMEVFHV
ncbi:MAG: substrate-binding domain-containing protein, partial [Lentisphaeria bacterium]|nr:substrate-binding domain-containing protein [Lentisphaeria bacterium]